MEPNECYPSRVVFYEPSPGRRFYGTVAAEPWKLGCGVWVTKLINMEPAYAAWSKKTGGKASTVYGAALDRLEPCDHRVAELAIGRQFPIQAEFGKPATTVPWWLAEVAYAGYAKAFPSSARDQSLERLAERGGFGRDELVRLIRGDDL